MDPRVPFRNLIQIKEELDFVVKCEPGQEIDTSTMYNTENIKIYVDKVGCNECHGHQEKIDSMSKQVEEITAQLLKIKAEHQAAFIKNKKSEAKMQHQKSKIDSMTDQIKDITTKLFESKAEAEAANIKNKENENQIAKLNMMVKSRQPNMYDVKKIVGHKQNKGKFVYLVRWDGYSSDDDSWVKEKDLKCATILRKYKSTLKN